MNDFDVFGFFVISKEMFFFMKWGLVAMVVNYFL